MKRNYFILLPLAVLLVSCGESSISESAKSTSDESIDSVIISSEEPCVSESTSVDTPVNPKLKESFIKVGKNYTLSFNLGEVDEFGYEEPRSSLYFYSGEEIFFQKDATMLETLESQDMIFYKTEGSSLLSRAVYDSGSETFDTNGWTDMAYSPIAYDAHVIQFDTVSLSSFIEKEDGSYDVKDGEQSALLPLLEPYNERRALFTDNAQSINVKIDESGYPLITMTYKNDAYEDVLNFKISIAFKEVGTTKIPDFVKSVSII